MGGWFNNIIGIVRWEYNSTESIHEIKSQTKIDFPGSVGIAGTLTYEDVTNVDSLGVGVIYCRWSGIDVTGWYNALRDEFHGNGANLTGVSGFATVLSTTQGTLENLCI